MSDLILFLYSGGIFLFKDVKSVESLSRYIGVSVKLINFVVYFKGVDSFYEEFSLPKKSGGSRFISCPKGPLKKLQKKLQKKLSEEYDNKYGSFNVSQAFIKKRNIMSNAKVHRNKKFILNLDIEDFFDEFNFGRVYGYLQKSNDFKMNKQLSVILSKIFTYKNKLPQGSPSSPVLTNFIFRIVDFKILKLSKKYKLDYTRYADDMTFSTNDSNFKYRYINFVEELKFLLYRQGFKINKKKTRLQFSSSKQEVTGLVVNKKINVSRKYYRDLRAQAFNLYSDGKYFIDGKKFDKLNKLEGRFAFVNQVKRYNFLIESRKYARKSKEYSNFIKSTTKYRYEPYLGGFDEQYRKFLFYKYFIHGSKPLIFVEGKTDIRYIKAAMMMYYNRYPELIRNNNGTFEFNIDFFKRGNEDLLKENYKRNEIDYSIKDYYLGLSDDGASVMSKIVEYWGIALDKKTKENKNYYDYFVNKLGNKSKKVILLFDNEYLDKKNKPLRSFLNHVYGNKATSQYRKLISEGKLVIADNLYLITLIKDKNYKKELENYIDDHINDKNFKGNNDLSIDIENLIDLSTITINQKTFNRNANKDSDKEFGKQTLSKYVYKHYNTVGLSGFIPLLDQLKEFCK
ncbi:hypothetical protein RZ78_02230 [Apilactobacillus kunkeei]|uniref:RNA-directed DNA polymerase n=1 Tax=Apilactobacillus kunkeei TaxID=148814 RepID=A0A0P7LRL7_9LACO|nr:hypothetical protein RZ78_02230 [Apilactobacillus kunkeei]